jgi:ankyrin repeat protein
LFVYFDPANNSSYDILGTYLSQVNRYTYFSIAMAFLSLPNEIILEIVECLDKPWQMVSVICVNQRLYGLLKDYPVQYNIRFQKSSALIWAARNGRLEMVRDLLRLRPDVNTKEGLKLDRTALCIAAKNGYLAMAKLLLEAGANPEVTGLQGQKPVITALVSGHEEIAGMIFSKVCSLDVPIANPNVDETPLHVACQYQRAKATRYFLEAGANVNAKDSKGSTPIQHLLRSRYLFYSEYKHDNIFETVSALLEFGAKPDPKSLQTLRHMFDQTPHRKAFVLRIGRTWMAPKSESDGGTLRPDISLHLNLLERKPRQVELNLVFK